MTSLAQTLKHRVISDAVHPMTRALSRSRRRAAARRRLAALTVTGTAPQAVVRALQGALAEAPSPEERAWIERIELMRELMSRSPQRLEIIDFGAGKNSEFDDGRPQARHSTARTLAQMTTASKPREDAYLLFRLVRELRPSSVLELGACVGVSASYMSSALELNRSCGRLITLEGADVLARRTARTLEELELSSRAEVREGRFADIIRTAVADLAPVGIAFIDGHHVESATLEYLEIIAPYAADEAVLVFDDIRWSDGMRRAWAAIKADSRFALTVDVASVGLAVISKSATDRHDIEVLYRS